MAKINVSIPQGTRDFGPDVVRKRQYIINTIKNIFELYGFEPLETPAIELLSVLEGKYGEEGNKLMYKIRSNENLRDKNLIVDQALNSIGYKYWIPKASDKALRYDLTIPFARYVAMNHNQLNFPFKRYQIQPVWRADRPQKSRYREFYQCDADVVGSNSLLNEIELANIYHQVFTRLGVKGYELRVNHRKILTALAEMCGGAQKMNDIAIVIDKLDKIGLDKVKEELSKKGFNKNQISIIEEYLLIKGTNLEKISQLKNILSNSTTDNKGIEELEFILNYGLPTYDSRLPAPESRLTIDFTLARGLDYYTGIIFEAKAPADVSIGSIGGGGRYDDLTGLFGVPGIPGTGISFGVDRIYDVMEELKLFPENVQSGTQVLFFNLGENESKKAFELVQQLRNKGVRCELFHENQKFDKQFKYAEKKNIPFIIIIGSMELQENNCTIKNIKTGNQQSISQHDLLKYSFAAE